MKILFIGKVWVEPNSSAAGKRMKQLLQIFKKRGEIHFACANTSTGNELDLEIMGIKIHHITLNDDSVNDFFSDLNPDIVVFDRFITEEQYGWRIIECCPNAIRILNTEDLHFLRKIRHQFVKKYDQIPTYFASLNFMQDDTMRELASIFRCDWTIIISTFEMDLLQNEMLIPNDLLVYLPIFAEQKKSLQVSFSEKKDFLFVGNMLHEPNLDAVKMLVNQCWPIIKLACSEARLIIAGAYLPQWIKQLENKKNRIVIIEHPKSLDEIYQITKISLVPLRFGAGIKGKILESMENGVPFISTSIGTEGMYFDTSWENSIDDDIERFSQKAIELYNNENAWNNMVLKGQQQLTNYFQKTLYEDQFLAQLDELIASYKEKRKKQYFSKLVQHHTLMSTRYLSKWIMEKNKRSVE